MLELNRSSTMIFLMSAATEIPNSVRQSPLRHTNRGSRELFPAAEPPANPRLATLHS